MRLSLQKKMTRYLYTYLEKYVVNLQYETQKFFIENDMNRYMKTPQVGFRL